MIESTANDPPAHRGRGAYPGRPRGGGTLLCPICNTPTMTINTVRIEKIVRRRRRCPNCDWSGHSQETLIAFEPRKRGPRPKESVD